MNGKNDYDDEKYAQRLIESWNEYIDWQKAKKRWVDWDGLMESVERMHNKVSDGTAVQRAYSTIYNNIEEAKLLFS